jgi:hypothetical protein
MSSPIVSPLGPTAPIAIPNTTTTPGTPSADPHAANFGTAPLAAADQLFIVEGMFDNCNFGCHTRQENCDFGYCI